MEFVFGYLRVDVSVVEGKYYIISPCRYSTSGKVFSMSSRRVSIKRFQRKGESTAPCGVERVSVLVAVPPP